jgi:hypothetical protein
MRLEGHDGSLDTEPGGGFPDAREQRAVATMHTVEITDRKRARTACFGIGKSAKNLHRSGRAWPQSENPRL